MTEEKNITNTNRFNNGLSSTQSNEIDDILMDISSLTLRVKDLGRHRSYSTAITKLDEARHWLNDRKHRAE